VLGRGCCVGIDLAERFRTATFTVAVSDFPERPPIRCDWDGHSGTAIAFLCVPLPICTRHSPGGMGSVIDLEFSGVSESANRLVLSASADGCEIRLACQELRIESIRVYTFASEDR